MAIVSSKDPRLWLSLLQCAYTLFDRNRNLLDDFEAEAFQRGNVHRRIRQQADALDAEVGENLAAEADGAEDAPGAGLRAFAGAQLLVQNEAVGGCGEHAVRKRRSAWLEGAVTAGVWSISKPREVLCR